MATSTKQTSPSRRSRCPESGRQASEGRRTPHELAELAELCYVTDEMAGIRRVRCGRGFSYRTPEGARIDDPAVRQRIHALAIPPAWSDVWICPLRSGHLQATGRDEKGRKQYLYHARWREVSNRTKFERMPDFGRSLPAIRRRVRKDLALPGLCRRKVLAAVARILDRTLIRVGNSEYAEENGSFGVTTLAGHHVQVRGSTVRFRFRGKGGRLHRAELHDRRLAKIIHCCEELPGQELFQFRDESGAFRPVGSADVNDYLQELSGERFTAKDFRTWRGSAIVAGALDNLAADWEKRLAKRHIQQALRLGAEALGNTPAICRDYYVHPRLLELYASGDLQKHREAFRPAASELNRDEQFLLFVLESGEGA